MVLVRLPLLAFLPSWVTLLEELQLRLERPNKNGSKKNLLKSNGAKIISLVFIVSREKKRKKNF
jgi:hypothetical protein